MPRATSPRDKCWQRQFVAQHDLLPQPWFAAAAGDRVDGNPLGATLLGRPGAQFLKPRFGSNGVGVVRVVSRDGHLAAESDCPDTARFLDEFPPDPGRLGCDVVEAVASRRGRYLDRATAGIPEWALGLSIVEGEIREDRVGGVAYEPRVVAQRAEGDRFATLGAVCKCVDTPVPAVVARDFREVGLEEAVNAFLAPRVPPEELGDAARRTADHVLAAGDRAAAAVAPLAEALGVRVHQFAVDGRLCWNAELRRVEFWFLEFQLGSGRQGTAARVPLALRPPRGSGRRSVSGRPLGALVGVRKCGPRKALEKVLTILEPPSQPLRSVDLGR